MKGTLTVTCLDTAGTPLPRADVDVSPVTPASGYDPGTIRSRRT